MKNKTPNKKVIIIIAVVAIVGIIIAIFALGKPKDGSDEEASNDVDPAKICEAIDAEWQSTIPEEQPLFLDTIDEYSSYTLGDVVEESEGFYTVSASVTSPDMTEGFNAYNEQTIGQTLTEEEMNSKLVEIIKAAPLKTNEYTISVIADEEGQLFVTFPVEFVDAMFGYVYIDSVNALNDALIGLEQGEE